MMYKNCHHHDSPKAVVKYYIRATIHTHDEKKLQYEQLLMIHEPPVTMQENATTSVTRDLSTWCCIDQGKGTLSV